MIPTLLLLLTPVPPPQAQETPPNPVQAWAERPQWRSIGPANMGGRIIDIAVHPTDPFTFWAATASGGLLKTTNNGNTYQHQFDRETTVSLGCVKVSASNPEVIWVGTGEDNPRNSVSYGNGVYKSEDGGKTWKHAGLENSFQIGELAIHPQDSNVVYVGALGRLYGPNSERGLFKTVDGGKNWERLLHVDDKTGVIDVDMHPTDPNTLIVATYERERDIYDTNDPAKKWGPGSGLYKTTDGGKSWMKLTQGLPTVNLGRIGIDYYHKDPNVVFAVIETEKIAGLPEDVAWLGVSTENADVGARITEVEKDSPADKAGLEKDDILIRIGEDTLLGQKEFLRAIRQHKAGDTVTFEFVRQRELQSSDVTFGEVPEKQKDNKPFSSGLGGQRENLQEDQGPEGWQTGGIYKSTDGGDSWTRINSLNPRPMYFSQIRVDPSDSNYLYVLGISLYRSKDGGKSFTGDGGGGGVHVDHHALWIDPTDGRHMILGNDGGIYVTHDRMESWDHHNKMAIGQFYHVTTDNRELYRVYGGLQDNGSWGGPNRTRSVNGPANEDWVSIGGGDGFICKTDPEDPDQVYFESQNGFLGSINLRTGQRGFMRPRAPEDGEYRFHWKTPFLLSHHNSRVYYAAGNHVFRSMDRGNHLRAISPEISAGDKGAATALAESPLDEDLLYVGTDDGALWVTRNGGRSWIDLMAEEPKDPLEERRDLLQQWALALDLDQDGAITAKEWPSSLADDFATWDLDGNGSLEGREFTALTERPAPAPKEEEEPLEIPPGDPITGIWAVEIQRGEGGGGAARFTGQGRAGRAQTRPEGQRSGGRGPGMEFKLRLEEGGKVSGSFQSRGGKGEIEKGLWDEEKQLLSFRYQQRDREIQVTATRQENGELQGKLSFGEGGFEMNFVARRKSDAQKKDEGPPSEALGKWSATLSNEEFPEEARKFAIHIGQTKAGDWSGKMESPMYQSKVVSGQFDPESGKLVLEVEGGGQKGQIEATISGNRMTGKIKASGGAMVFDFEAQREGGAPGQDQKETAGKTLIQSIPKPMHVSSLEASAFEAGRVYLCLDGHRSDLDQPYIFVSEDYGVHWKPLAGDLPRGSSRVLREDLENPDVLYLGTEFGAWISADRGDTWSPMGKNFPTVAVHEFAQHPTRHEIVAGTHGRSLWVADVSMPRQWNRQVQEEDVHLYKPNRVTYWSSMQRRGIHGLQRFTGTNPATETVLAYSLNKAQNGLTLRVEQLDGEVVKTFEPVNKPGTHFLTWDLRRDSSQAQNQNRRRGRRRGSRLQPGSYRVVLEAGNRRLEQSLEIEDDPEKPASRWLWQEEDALNLEREGVQPEGGDRQPSSIQSRIY